MLRAKLIHLETVDSTNNYAAKFMQDNKSCHGTVILADEQTNGRGQRGSFWQSEAGSNLQFSLIVEHVNFPIDFQHSLTHLISVALVKTLGKYGIEGKIKWPNDIFVQNKKIAGILIENTIEQGRIRKSIIGVGLNVNQILFPEIQATSIFLETGTRQLNLEVLYAFVNELEKLWATLEIQSYKELKDAYYKHLMAYKQLQKFEDKSGVFVAILEGVSDEGKLLLYKNGNQASYDIKEVKFLFN